MHLDENLVFDVGLHRGEDTEFYLKKGYRVVAFEANRELVEYCKSKFAKELERGQLHIVEGAIAPPGHGEAIEFYLSNQSVWGTSCRDWDARNQMLGATSEKTQVNRVDIAEAFNIFGIPFYIKIDIEGMDRYVLDVVCSLPKKPKYISIESEKVHFEELVAELDTLQKSGYKSFKVVQQKDIPGSTVSLVNNRGDHFTHTFPSHSSGCFGEDIHQPWMDHVQALNQYVAIFRKYERSGDFAQSKSERNGPLLLDNPGWFDTHAKLHDTQAVERLVTVVVTCRNRLEHVRTTLPKLAIQSNLDIVFVDYGCEEKSGNWVSAKFPNVNVVFVENVSAFHLSRARNIGALHARTDYIMFADADTIIDFPINTWLENNALPGEFYRIDPRFDAALCGVVVVNRHDFWNVGGYDEAFTGWGWEDTELYARLKRKGLKELIVSSDHIASIKHDDSKRQLVDDTGAAMSKEAAMLSGFLYTKIKDDLVQQGLDLPLDQRCNLIGKLRDYVTHMSHAPAPDEDNLSYHLNINGVAPGFLDSIKISYNLKRQS